MNYYSVGDLFWPRTRIRRYNVPLALDCDPRRRLPFEDHLKRAFHFGKHKNEFAFASDVDYEAAADTFIAGAAISPTRECTRTNGDRVRFNRRTQELAVVAPSGWLKTFHRPSQKYISVGYFYWECGKEEDI